MLEKIQFEIIFRFNNILSHWYYTINSDQFLKILLIRFLVHSAKGRAFFWTPLYYFYSGEHSYYLFVLFRIWHSYLPWIENKNSAWLLLSISDRMSIQIGSICAEKWVRAASSCRAANHPNCCSHNVTFMLMVMFIWMFHMWLVSFINHRYNRAALQQLALNDNNNQALLLFSIRGNVLAEEMLCECSIDDGVHSCCYTYDRNHCVKESAS